MSLFSLSDIDCAAGVCDREGAADGAGDGRSEGVVEDALFTNPWNMLPRTLDDPGLDNGGCNVGAR